jgi:hypothetical protein
MSQHIVERINAAKESGNTKEYNELLQSKEYIDYLNSFDSGNIDDLLNTEDIVITQSPAVLQKSHTGITNVLNGIVSNTKKGKYTETDKLYLVNYMKDIIIQLESIDADECVKEKNNRISKYSSIGSRI